MGSIGPLIVLEIGVKDVPVFGAAWPLYLPDGCHLGFFALHLECSAWENAWFASYAGGVLDPCRAVSLRLT